MKLDYSDVKFKENGKIKLLIIAFNIKCYSTLIGYRIKQICIIDYSNKS